ncbi:MAG: GNAT family N-acetyltransferase [Armatimonadota bacterium]
MNEVTVRNVGSGDLPRCARVYVEAFAEPPYREDWSLVDAEAMLEVYLRRDPSLCFCAEFGGDVVGIAFCSSVSVYRASIEELAVLPAMQGTGIGKALLNRCLEEFASRGNREVTLVVDANAPAYGFYRRHGFRPTRRHVLMVREL